MRDAIQFGFHARHRMLLQCLRLTDHVTLNFNNNTSPAALFLDIQQVFDTTWYTGFSYKLFKSQFSASITKPITSFLSNRKCRIRWSRNINTPGNTTVVPQVSVLFPTLYNLYTNYKSKILGFRLVFFAHNTYVYRTNFKKVNILRKLQYGLNSVESWRER
jgi:hypothetical protein